MKKLIYTPDEILAKKCPECPVPVVLTFYHAGRGEPKPFIQAEAYEILKGIYGTPTFILASKHRTLTVWIVPYRDWDNIKTLLSCKEVEKLQEFMKLGIDLYSGFPEELWTTLMSKGYLIVSSARRWGLTKKEARQIKENAKAFAPLMNKLREEGLIKAWRVGRTMLYIVRPDDKAERFLVAYKTPKGFKVEGKFYKNPDEVRDFIIWYFDLKPEKVEK